LQPPVLWHIELSHYNEKARWALDYKAIPHVRRAPLPGLHAPVAMAVTRSTHRKLPVLVLDGRRIGDSTRIIAALEEYRPDPPLYPADPAERRRALELEDFFDETLAPAVRRLNFHHSLDDPDLMVDLLFASNTRGWQAKALRPMLPVARPIVKRDYQIGGEELDRALDEIHAAMDRIEREVAPSGYMVGDAFSVADLTAAALFTPLIVPPERQYPPLRLAPAMAELREEMAARDGGQWVYEMFRRHRGVSAEVGASGES
jgi:glutathione S-transferase